jgi:hypothetical protein
VDNVLDGFGVVCFSGKDSDILMWSHYADNHRGICLQYKFEVLQKGVAENLLKIEYPPNSAFPLFSEYCKNNLQVVAKELLIRKSAQWSYENEWRIILALDNLPQYVPTPSNSLVGIIFGCNMTRLERNQIIAELKELNVSLTPFEAKKSKSKYELEIIPFPSPL